MDNNNHNQQSNGIKKKTRGNRKLQRYRAKLRKRGLNINSIMILLNANTTNKSITSKKSNDKRKLKQTNELIVKSISKQQKQMMQLKETLIIKPNYLTMTDMDLRQKLLTVLDNNESMIQCLDTTETLNYIRQYAQLLNNLYCLKYEQDLWQTSYHVSMIAGVWSRTITREMAFENNLHRYLFTTCANIEKHQKIIINQLNKTQHDLIAYQYVDSSINKKLLFKMITTLVGNELHRVRMDYEWKKLLFQYEANDYRLVKLFYDLKPTEDQIHSAKFIWQMTVHILKVEEQLKLASQSLHTIEQWNYNKIICSIKRAEETIRNDKKLINDESKKSFYKPAIISSSTFCILLHTIKIRQSNINERAQHLLKHPMIFVPNPIPTI